MGLFDKFKKDENMKKTQVKSPNTLEVDIKLATEWVVNALNYSGYKADFKVTLESVN